MNKHLESCFETENGDRFRGLIQVGPKGFKVKPKVNLSSLVGGEFKETNMGPWNPLGWPENHHQVVVVAV